MSSSPIIAATREASAPPTASIIWGRRRCSSASQARRAGSMRNSTRSMAQRPAPTSRSRSATPRRRRNATDVLRLFGMVPEPNLVERFCADLDALLPRDKRVGLAVSGGPDSLALLLLAAAQRPGQIEAATIDHALRAGSRDEAAMVAATCERLGVPHAILTARWSELPETAIQERARHQRYSLLAYWAEERRLDAIATAHHAEDQAETVLMRLARGAGVKGLAGMRPRSVSPGAHVRLVRPLLGWRRAELEQVCAAAGVTPALDPS